MTKRKNSVMGTAKPVTVAKPAVLKPYPRRPEFRYYVAYGSNLNVYQMERRCPAAVPVGAIAIPGVRLVFRGVADVIVDPSATLQAGIWKVTDKCEHALDIYEGVRSGLYRRRSLEIDLPGRKPHKVRALIYKMDRDRFDEPTDGYFNTIRQGYYDFGLDKAALYEARSWRPEDPLRLAAE